MHDAGRHLLGECRVAYAVSGGYSDGTDKHPQLIAGCHGRAMTIAINALDYGELQYLTIE
jgi:hypothetical protein